MDYVYNTEHRLTFPDFSLFDFRKSYAILLLMPVKKPTRTKAKKAETGPIEIEETQSTYTPGSFVTKKIIIIACVILLIAGALYLARSLFIASIVNGQVISRMAVVKQLESQGGKRILDNMIAQTLIKQEGEKQHIVVNESDLDKEAANTEAQLASQGQSITDMGLTKQEFREQIRLEKIIEAILGKDVTISNDEIQKFVDDNRTMMPQSSDSAQLATIAKQQLLRQRIGTKVQPWLAELQKNAKITNFVSY